MKRDTKNIGIEIIIPGSDIDLLVTAIFKRTFLVCDQYSRHIPKQDIEELDHEGEVLVARGWRNEANRIATNNPEVARVLTRTARHL